jgi:hypothetical protein
MDSTFKEIQFVTPKNKYTAFYYKIPVSFGSPFVCGREVNSTYIFGWKTSRSERDNM